MDNAVAREKNQNRVHLEKARFLHQRKKLPRLPMQISQFSDP